MDARCAVAVLICAAELQGNAMFAEEMKKIVALDESVRKFGVGNPRTTSTDAVLYELAIEKLSHGEGFANFS